MPNIASGTLDAINKLSQALIKDFSIRTLNSRNIKVDCLIYIDFPGGKLFRDGRFYCNVSQPDFIGVSCLYGEDEESRFSLQLPNTVNEIKVISADVAYNLIDNKQLHKYTSKLLAARNCRLLRLNEFNLYGTSYRKVRSIIYYVNLSDTKNSTVLSELIIDLTGLSRSWVMNILFELKKGGYILTRRGILININKELPFDF